MQRRKGIPQYNECKKVRGNIEIVTADNINVAYIRHIGTYEELTIAFPKMIEKLFHYAAKQNYHVFEDTKVLTIYHDHHEFTEDYHLRTSLCVTISDESTVETNDVGIMVIPSGKYAVGHFEICQDEYKGAWDFIYGEWLQIADINREIRILLKYIEMTQSSIKA